jgi:hypothetical protein
MADIVWPDELPGTLRLEGLSDTLGDNTIRSAVDAGPEKTRPRSTAAPDTVSGTMIVSTAQSVLLDTFYKQTTAGGALEFRWRHPRTGAEGYFRFKAPPSYTSAGGLWIAKIEVEKMV